jgi:hypothetical protein
VEEPQFQSVKKAENSLEISPVRNGKEYCQPFAKTGAGENILIMQTYSQYRKKLIQQ